MMGMTMTQKILAAHAGLSQVTAGQLIEADLDLVLGNDVTAPVAIHEMEKMKMKKVFDRDKIALVPIISHRIRISSLRSIANVYVNLQSARTSLIILRSVRWE
jgi:homoaconitase/3-isopropylmalate dehydratase large subunit